MMDPIGPSWDTKTQENKYNHVFAQRRERKLETLVGLGYSRVQVAESPRLLAPLSVVMKTPRTWQDWKSSHDKWLPVGHQSTD